MNPNLKAVLDYLDQLGAKLGAAGQELFKQMVSYRLAQAITGIVVAVAVFGFGYFLFNVIEKIKESARANFEPHPWERKFDPTVYNCFRWISLCLCTVIGLIILATWLPDLISPSGAVVTDLINGLRLH